MTAIRPWRRETLDEPQADQWQGMAVALAGPAFYLAAVRRTRCRVETLEHRPCRWRVRGVFGTCDYHLGHKKGLPTLVRGDGFFGLPTFTWPRDGFARAGARTTVPPERQPNPGARGAAAEATPRRPGYEWVRLGITGASAVIALASFARDLVAT